MDSYIIGIDYSLNCPAVCVLNSNGKFQDSYHYYLTNTKKYVGNIGNNIFGSLHSNYLNHPHRYENLANWVLKCLSIHKNIIGCYIEDYSLGSKNGLIVNIAENCGLLKYFLYHNNISYNIISPKSIKKFAGNGNAKKSDMYKFFLQHTDIDLIKIFNYTGNNISSPIADVVDAYFIAKYGLSKI